ncbi:hypothetical protein R1flu_017482 [Riccia fluitans]|uniref:Uncharacterized protein n=1 Tax=Riccia fluitans TaxID=41844 RepID=A0ABD1ZH41_9MARC
MSLWWNWIIRRESDCSKFAHRPIALIVSNYITASVVTSITVDSEGVRAYVVFNKVVKSHQLAILPQFILIRRRGIRIESVEIGQ